MFVCLFVFCFEIGRDGNWTLIFSGEIIREIHPSLDPFPIIVISWIDPWKICISLEIVIKLYPFSNYITISYDSVQFLPNVFIKTSAYVAGCRNVISVSRGINVIYCALILLDGTG